MHAQCVGQVNIENGDKNSIIQTIFDCTAICVLDNGDKNNNIINHASTRACHLANEWYIITPQYSCDRFSRVGNFEI